MINYSDLPLINASLNGASAVLLISGFVFIRRKQQAAHAKCMIGALICSIIFLACYLTYHAHVGTTHFRNPAWFRPIYVPLLISHTVLAIAVVPLVVVTLSRALRTRFELHKKIARWTWPVWIYVSVTGVIVYLLLYQIYPQR